MASKSKAEIATIDCALVTATFTDDDGVQKTFGFDTASQVSVSVETETTDAIQLVVKGILRSQKPKSTTITGNTITLTDNVFNPELVVLLQGGTVEWDTDGTLLKYEPPVVGSDDKGKVFDLTIYSAHYSAAGIIIDYEKVTYPNCQGDPIALSMQDDTFRSSEYTITSYPDNGQAPYTIEYVDDLPTLEDV